jgi:choline dehydrogenase-like flavoprotein
MDTQYDVIIVGGGAAGSVLANRLSARSANRVLLCEAGEDTPVGAVPDVIPDSFPGPAFLNPCFLWNELEVTTEAIPHNRPDIRPRLRKYEQARVLGGGSSINGQLLNRGAPHDATLRCGRGRRLRCSVRRDGGGSVRGPNLLRAGGVSAAALAAEKKRKVPYPTYPPF